MPGLLEGPRLARPEKAFDETVAGPFGTIVWQAIQDFENIYGHELTIERIAATGGFEYSHLHGIIKGRRGSPVKARPETVTKLLETLQELGVRINVQQALRAAEIVPIGYTLVREGEDRSVIQREIDPDLVVIGESLSGKPPSFKRAVADQIKQMERLWLDAQREGAIGRRAEDEEE